ncbi:GNAT family N-acetyltransferase [Zobellia galactanivorans]|uniref:GCN5-related N-acetyltransferase n=1 Tax=Zobellia galactanivorans (strain DSM 12802 / CCUG 47099 / CIP 106680 / NCIMB 13871 / Dsij) TaxID=63186 RepID=G0L2D0_ZOBGA|nr:MULTISPECIES: GNAT family N-acetyltransferase [Zobellia]MDO6807642.1 GNAT family N-acetyltransferase [Zobellia galactanivorans]OWW25451.1 N-acetyltransferase [Zobellia sp. OII3]CAZ98054.1 GCN5-related N-acetyltransferase [Zobellia galactanivorans]
MGYKTGPLQSNHDRGNFDCGYDLLDNYLKKQASQDIKRNLSICFVLSDESDIVKGYYTLSNASIKRNLLPEAVTKRLPKSYNELPVTLLGRLAIDTTIKGNGFGELMLIDALKRAFDVSQDIIGSIAVIVDPIDDKAKRFYLKYGFIDLPDCGKMFLPMKTIGQLFK